jgi:proteasome lid subunit RPN8/RPN11
MSLAIEVFRSDDYFPDGEIPLLPVLRGVFREIIGPDLTGVRYQLRFYELMDLTPDHGKPALVNLRASHGFVRVRISRNGELLYQHPHPVRELIGEPLRALLRLRDPEVTHWGYGLRGPGLEYIALSRPAPRVSHELRVTGPRRRSIFTVEEMPDPEPPERGLADLGADIDAPARSIAPAPQATETAGRPEQQAEAQEPGAAQGETDAPGTDAEPPEIVEEETDTAAQAAEIVEQVTEGARQRRPAAATKAPPVVIAIPGSLVTSLVQTFPFSEEIEEGGFLVGEVYRDKDRAGGYLAHVTAVIPAERTGASMINFTFTGESFLRISEQLASRGGGEVLLGWYHTHLFPATSKSGLSSVDVELHRSTFRRPWQVAALVNISGGHRVLRFYHGDSDEMSRVPYWTVPS